MASTLHLHECERRRRGQRVARGERVARCPWDLEIRAPGPKGRQKEMDYWRRDETSEHNHDSYRNLLVECGLLQPRCGPGRGPTVRPGGFLQSEVCGLSWAESREEV